MSDGKRIDQWVAMAPGEIVDIGWAVATRHPDGAVIARICKGCHRVWISRILPSGDVEPCVIEHAPDCSMWAHLGNNAETS